jgi:hypothetical protein
VAAGRRAGRVNEADRALNSPAPATAPSLSRDFIVLTLRFAEHVARLTRLPLADALCRFTPLYLSFGLARDFDPLHPVWRAFVAGLTPGRDLMDWTHAFYLRRQADAAVTDADVSPTFGCFSYVLWPGDRIRIHFRNRELPDRSPLRHERMPRRLAELSAMFKHLTTVVPPPRRSSGGRGSTTSRRTAACFHPAF